MSNVKSLVERWYEDLWNRWDVGVCAEIVHKQCRLRGSLGGEYSGPDGVMAYLGRVKGGFSDFRNHVEKLVLDGPTAFAHLRYTGTHDGHILGAEPTRKAIEYQGLARFREQDGKLIEITVYGDVEALRRQIGPARTPAPPENQRVFPGLRSSDWARTREFYKKLGFEVVFEWRHGPDFPVYAGISGHGSVLHLMEHTGGPRGGMVTLRVDDVDEVHARLRAAGIEAAEPEDRPWGDRDFEVRDPDDNGVTFFCASGDKAEE